MAIKIYCEAIFSLLHYIRVLICFKNTIIWVNDVQRPRLQIVVSLSANNRGQSVGMVRRTEWCWSHGDKTRLDSFATSLNCAVTMWSPTKRRRWSGININYNKVMGVSQSREEFKFNVTHCHCVCALVWFRKIYNCICVRALIMNSRLMVSLISPIQNNSIFNEH